MNPEGRDDPLLHCHMSLDNVCEDNEQPDTLGWCFWDETGGCHGPWNTFEEARVALKDYVEWLG